MSLSQPNLPMIAEKEALELLYRPDGLSASFPYIGCVLTLASLLPGCCTT
jgi:hypothetical protein